MNELDDKSFWHVRPLYMAVRCRKNLTKGRMTFIESPSATVRNILERVTKYKFMCPLEYSKFAIEVCKKYSCNWTRTYDCLGISAICGHYKNGAPVGGPVLSRMDEHIKNADADFSAIYYDKNGIARFDYPVIIQQEKKEKIIRCARSLNMFFKGRYVRFYPVTWLRECELCGKMSTPKIVNNRAVWGWEGNKGLSKTNLCTGCWNKVKPIYKAVKETEQIKYLSNKLVREANKCQRSKQQAI